MAAPDWAGDPQVIAALVGWTSAQRALDAVRPDVIPTDITELDIQLRAAQSRAMTAWHMYEKAREAAGGPKATEH
jgi:hypothetical protein